MTQEFQDMLYLLGWNYKSQIDGSKREYNVGKIKELAVSQGVWTLVFPELEKHADLSQYLNDFMAAVSIGLQRSTFQLQTISDLNAAGFKACLLKGAAVALAYPDPTCRISSDADILIDPAQEREIISFLEGHGYSVKPREKNDHHFKAYHPTGGLLEGHVRLYSVPTEKILLDGIKLYDEEWAEEEIEGYKIPILGLNDGLMYLTAHYIKHLVNEGGGVRQMLDLLLYIERYRDRLDFDRYEKLLKQLRYDKLVDVIKTIGAKYWDFDYPIKYEALADEILTDSEAGGIFGFDTDMRAGFYNEYCSRRGKSALKSTALLTVKNERGLINVLFPRQKDLMQQKEYRYARHTMLVPVAWVHRFFALIKKRLTKGGKHENSAIESRLEMMRELSMI